MPPTDERRQSNDQMHTDLAVLRERIDLWIRGTETYRASLCTKIDTITKELEDLKIKIVALPCKEGKSRWDSIDRQMKWLWTVTGGMVLGILVEYYKKK